MKNVMIDLETLGTKPGSVILSIGAVMFDENGLGSEFYTVINRNSCIDAGLTIDGATMLWWDKQAPEARTVLEATLLLESEALLTAMVSFATWLRQQGDPAGLNAWGNGSDFDNVLIDCAYRAVNVTNPFRFYNNRCYRTLKNLVRSVPLQERTGTYHNALDDAKTQAVHAVELLKVLNFGLNREAEIRAQVPMQAKEASDVNT